MATTESSASNSASQIHPRYSIDSSSISRSCLGAIHDDPAPSYKVNADKKHVWNKEPSTSSAKFGPVIGADSWPSLSPSTRPSSDKSPSLSHGSSSMPMPTQVVSLLPTTCIDHHHLLRMIWGCHTLLSSLFSTSLMCMFFFPFLWLFNMLHKCTARCSNSSKFQYQRQCCCYFISKPFRRNNSTSSDAPLNTRHQNHSQRSGSYSPGSRNSHKFRHGNRRNFEHGNQSGFSHRNYSGRDMHLQPQRAFGMMRPQMLMGPPSFPASSAQYMAAPHIVSNGGPILYSEYAPHVFIPHPPPESMALVGHFPPLPMYIPSFDAMLYNKILTQVEYYFSADNLSRDKHLRGQMNDEGWVPVRVIAGFRRLGELTNDIQTILEALRSSEVVEIKDEALRRRGDWDKYLLPHERSGSGPAGAGNNNASLGSQLESMTLSERESEGTEES